MLAERGAGDDPEPLVGEPRDREVALDPAARVQHRGVGDRADVAGDAVRAQPLEERRPRPRPRPRSWRTTSRRRAPPSRGRRGARRRSPATRAARPSRAAAATRRRGRRSARTSSPAPSPTSRRTRRRARRAARRSARAAAAARPAARGPGTSRRSRSRRPRACGRACSRGERYARPKRRESMCQTSSDGTPSTIHSATSCPSPPAPASPCAQKPAAVQRPRTSVGPRMNSPSGVNASGPLISLITSASLERRHADDRVLHQLLEPRPVLGEQLAVEVRRDPVERPRRRVALVAAHDQAARLRAGSRRAATGRASSACRSAGPTACVIRYSCAIGTIGTFTPASAPISFANIPPALTTTSASISPLSVTTPVDAAALDRDRR